MNLADVGHYYSERLREHGASAKGVDWNSADSQRLRFAQLLRICGERQDFSLNDIGCGYGAFLDYLAERGKRCDYLGVDVAAPMTDKARELHPGSRFLAGDRADRSADYSVASGIFNVKLSTDPADWRVHILETLDHLNETSKNGFAFNCLTKYSDADRMKEHLYYADPAELFDHCKRGYSRNVALLHDYGLYEFTILVRKDIPA